MCGRASLTKVEKDLEKRFNAQFYSEDLERYHPLPNYNIAPTHMHPIITNDATGSLQYFQWGLIPFWAKDKNIGSRMINARMETVHEKPAFKNALQRRRCLVPFDGFYEWKKNGKVKQPYRIVLTDTEIFTVAGLWEKWKSPDGTTIHSFTVLTQTPNQFMADIHDRMPAILLPEQERLWLDMELDPMEALKLIQPLPDEMMKAYPVSKKVNKVGFNDATLIEAIELNDIGGEQISLF